VASVLVSAGRRCERSGIVDALRFSSWRAWEIAPSTETGIEYSRALAADKRLGQAVTALAAAEDLMETPTEAVQLLRWWASLAARMPIISTALDDLAARADSWFPGNAEVHGEIGLVQLSQLQRGIDRVAVATRAEEIATTIAFAPSTRIAAAAIAGVETAYLGNIERGMQLLTMAERLHHSLEEEPHIPGDDQTVEQDLYCRRALLRCLSGVDIELVESELVYRMNAAIESREYRGLGYLGTVAASLARYRGDFAAAVAEMRGAEARFMRSDPDGLLPWAQCSLADMLARAGSIPEALAKIREATRSAASVGRSEWLRFIADCTAVEILAQSDGRPGQQAMAESLARDLDVGGPVVKAWMLSSVIEHGEPNSQLVAEYESAAAATDLPVLIATARRMKTGADGDARELDRAAEALADLGAYGEARKASTDAAALHTAHGDRAAAAVSRSRAEGFAEAIHGGHTWAAPPNDPAGSLTGREHEIAQLAAKGLSNREIARTLFLSVRTVESHLYQARVKLGAPSRRELAALLDVPTD
jgi:DNA-binding CsgD family transcriptional regulator